MIENRIDHNRAAPPVPAPSPFARNATVSSVPRALGLFSFTKSLFLRRAAALLFTHHSSSLPVKAVLTGNKRLLPFLCMG